MVFVQECSGDRFMPFHRANYDKKTGQSPNTPREQKNSMTSWLDASFVYSTKVSPNVQLRKCRNHYFQYGGKLSIHIKHLL